MKRQTITIGGVVGALVLAGGGVAFAQTQGSSGSYRTAAVTVGDVDKTIDLTGTVTASSRRDLSFSAAGTIAKVSVKAGSTVKSGDVLATLDPTQLDDAVTKATATLAKARAQLESDQNSQSSTVAAASASTGSTPSTKPATSGSGSGSGTSVSPEVTAALADLKSKQEAVMSAQTEATTAITASKAALSAQIDACKSSDPVPESADPTPESSGGTDEADDTESTETGVLSPACADALDAVQSAQDVVAAKQDALQSALQDLSSTLAKAVDSLSKPSTPTSTPSTGSGSSPSADSSTSSSIPSASASSSSAARTGSPSAGSIAQDQAAIDTAQAQLTEAKITADAASLTAPFSGKVLSVSVSKGDTVSTGDVAIVLVGTGTTTATATVTVDQIVDVKRGQTAAVTPAGADKPVTGTVTSIGLLPDSSSDTTTYPITLDLEGDLAAPEGTTASIALVTGTVKDALTVPSSAITKTGRTTVSVLTDGQVTRTVVTVGIVGPSRTSITAGLKKGQQVVLADLDAALPSSESGATTRGLEGGFGGGGGRAGGGAGGARAGGGGGGAR